VTRFKIGDLILIYFYDVNDPTKQRILDKQLAVVLTEKADEHGYIRAQYLDEPVGVRIAHLLADFNGLDEYGRIKIEIISR